MELKDEENKNPKERVKREQQGRGEGERALRCNTPPPNKRFEPAHLLRQIDLPNPILNLEMLRIERRENKQTDAWRWKRIRPIIELFYSHELYSLLIAIDVRFNCRHLFPPLSTHFTADVVLIRIGGAA